MSTTTTDFVWLGGTLLVGLSALSALLYKLSATTEAPAAAPKKASASKSKSKKKAKSKEAKAPVTDSEPEPEPVEEQVELDAAAKKKAKKAAKKAAKAAEEAAALAAEEAAALAAEEAAALAAEEAAAAAATATTSKKKKKNKSAASASESVAAPVAAVAEEDDWQEIKPAKAKKAAAKKAAAEPAPAPAPAVIAEVVSAPPSGMPPPVPKAKKAKKAKAPVEEGAAAVAAVPSVPVEEEWTTVPTRKSSKSRGLNMMDAGVSGLDAALADGADGGGTAEEEPAFVMDLGDSLGTVIGKGGSNIRAITEQSGARLDIEKGSTLCKISGAADAIRRAAALVQSVLDRRAEELANLHTLVIPVGSKAPAVLGKGGCIIRKITTETGARMDVSCEAGTVTVMGSEEQVAAAAAAVKNVLHGEAQEVIDLGGRGVYVVKGAGGATIRRLQEETGARFDIDPVAKALTISGAKEQVAKAAALVRQTLVSNSCELDVAVQEADVGAVVGKGGVTIKQIQAESGASLEIQRGFAGSLSIVKLIGTAQQVAAAKQLVEKCVSREPELKAGEVCETLELGGAVGLVIGSAGAAVKQLQEETGAKVDILRGCGTCKVFGAPEAVAVAKAKIEEKMAAHADREAKAAAAAEAAAANGGWEAAAAPPGAEDWSAATDGSGSHWTPADAPVVGGPPPMGSWGSAAVPAAPAGWVPAATGAPPGFFGAGSAANPEPW